MKINLFESIKTRLFDELEDTIGKNSEYRDKVKIYHKFPYKERVQHGIVLKNMSFNRQKLSPDDFVGILRSHFALARAGNKSGEFLEWVWEDPHNLVKHFREDVSSQITGSNRMVQLSNKFLTKGPGNTELLSNFRQVKVFIDGVKSYAQEVDAVNGLVTLYTSPPAGARVEISYFYRNVAKPGRYYLEIVQDGPELKYVVNPLYSVKEEIVIANAKGSEIGGNLENQNIMVDQVILFMRKPGTDYSVRLIRDEEYTIDITGAITFIGGFSLEPHTNLIAYYRWIGEEIGPVKIPEDNRYDHETIKGAVLCFNNKVNLGDKVVLIVYPEREVAARVYGGHFNVSLDIEIFTRDTVQLPGMVDYIINDIWNNKRIPLISEGITIDELDSGGETEEVYDENTGDLYYKNSLNMAIISEWKKFVPVLFEVIDFDLSFSTLHIRSNEYVDIYQNRVVGMESKLYPKKEPFEVEYGKPGYPMMG